MADVTFTAVAQPAPACYPPDFNALMQMIVNLALRGTVPDNSGGGIFVGSSPPVSSLTNRVWFKTDVAGRPLGIFMFYNGNWRKVYTGTIGDIKMFTGARAYFDATGLGVVGGDQDGWALCNGSNGTPNLQDRFMVSANYGYTAWETAVNPDVLPSVVGGLAKPTIVGDNLPPLSARIQFASVGGGGGSNPVPLGPSDTGTDFFVFDLSTGRRTHPHLPFNTLPPYYTLAYCMFVGYA